MTKPNLTDEDYSDLAKLVREAIGAEPYPYRAAHQEIARLLAKLGEPSGVRIVC
jgi:hypothetical protein